MKGCKMKTRIISAVIAIAIAIPFIYLGGYPYKIAIGLIALWSYKEIISLKKTHEKLPTVPMFLGLLGLLLIVFANTTYSLYYSGVSYIYLSVLCFGLIIPTLFYDNYSIKDAFHLIGLLLFIGLGFNSLILVRNLDLKLFNKVLTDLMNGNKTNLPTYNFITGEKEMSTTPIVLNENDCLVIEGLHGLNPNLISDEYQDLIYKIYISPLTPLNVDRHNYVSTTENRLLRRIIRDFRTRGKSGEDSLASWESVRRGEEAYIFPYTDSADAIINTAYTYEIGVLKVYVEPILYSIDINSKYYNEARRIIDHLKTFYPIPSEYVREDNLLREFIGGSSFE